MQPVQQYVAATAGDQQRAGPAGRRLQAREKGSEGARERRGAWPSTSCAACSAHPGAAPCSRPDVLGSSCCRCGAGRGRGRGQDALHPAPRLHVGWVGGWVRCCLFMHKWRTFSTLGALSAGQSWWEVLAGRSAAAESLFTLPMPPANACCCRGPHHQACGAAPAALPHERVDLQGVLPASCFTHLNAMNLSSFGREGTPRERPCMAPTLAVWLGLGAALSTAAPPRWDGGLAGVSVFGLGSV